MTLQAVRSFYETPIISAFDQLDVKLILDNMLYDDNDAATEFGTMMLMFNQSTAVAITCPPEDLRGLIVIEVYVPKGQGPGRCQRILTEVMTALQTLNDPLYKTDTVYGSVGRVSGPTFKQLKKEPYFAGRLSVPFKARYTG